MTFVQALGDGLLKLLMDIPTIIVFALFIAVLLNQKMIGRAAFRAIFFMPVILSTGLMASIDMQNFDPTEDPTGGIDTGAQTGGAAEIVSSMDVEALFSNMVIGGELATTVATVFFI
jgi:ABC-type sugar transport system permease subunit